MTQCWVSWCKNPASVIVPIPGSVDARSRWVQGQWVHEVVVAKRPLCAGCALAIRDLDLVDTSGRSVPSGQ